MILSTGLARRRERKRGPEPSFAHRLSSLSLLVGAAAAVEDAVPQDLCVAWAGALGVEREGGRAGEGGGGGFCAGAGRRGGGGRGTKRGAFGRGVAGHERFRGVSDGRGMLTGVRIAVLLLAVRVKKTLAKAMKQNRQVPQWIRFRTGNTVRSDEPAPPSRPPSTACPACLAHTRRVAWTDPVQQQAEALAPHQARSLRDPGVRVFAVVYRSPNVVGACLREAAEAGAFWSV